MAELLSLRGVSLSFRRGRGRLPVLVDASLEVGRGEIVAVVGSRAEGKTTLLEVAAGILPPDEGQVWLGEVPDAPIRADALSSLAHMRGNIDGAALFWTLSRARNPNLIGLLASYEMICDFLDSANEPPAAAHPANGHRRRRLAHLLVPILRLWRIAYAQRST